MRKIVVIAMREYKAAVQTKAFIISILAMPLFMIGSIVVQNVLKDKVDTTDKRIAVWDRTGKLFDDLERASHARDTTDVYSGEGPTRKKVRPRFLLEAVHPASDSFEQATLELSERVRKEEIFAFLVIGPDVIEPKEDPIAARVAYHSNNPNYDDFERWAAGALNNAVQNIRFQAVDLKPDVVQRATQRVMVANLGLVSLGEDGSVTQAQEVNEFANFIVPFGMMMLMFMVVMVAASPLVQGVLEEKMQRIAEVLLGSATPFQLMSGKLLGIVGVSLTIATIYLVGAYLAIRNAGYDSLFPVRLVWWFVVYQALAVVLYGSLFIAVGAAVSDLKEAQSMMMPVTLLIFAPMFVWINVLREPMATSSLALSLFPPATPMLMILRQCVAPGMPLWQPLLGIVLVLLTTLGTVFVAGRIFRVGLLMQGKGANLSEMIRWAIRG